MMVCGASGCYHADHGNGPCPVDGCDCDPVAAWREHRALREARAVARFATPLRCSCGRGTVCGYCESRIEQAQGLEL